MAKKPRCFLSSQWSQWQRNSYTIEEKRKAVELALRTLNSHVAQLYSLDLTMVDRWVKALSQVPSPSPSHS
ncbi:hypothetical protein C2G38_2206251 [Gigaspora rosea]|uniref:Uncharacterized protein n=1 Tax=Gigaspora rosea TaxID=44941 RepID=A0A397UNU0_9GLOM|nr:hypothetical protein C2G38_2206251 [Gigaspora rosea]